MWLLRATERHFGEVKMSANIEKIDIDIALRFPPQMQLCGTGESTKSTPASSSALGFSPTLCLSIRFSIIKQGEFLVFFCVSIRVPHICNFICLKFNHRRDVWIVFKIIAISKMWMLCTTTKCKDDLSVSAPKKGTNIYCLETSCLPLEYNGVYISWNSSWNSSDQIQTLSSNFF